MARSCATEYLAQMSFRHILSFDPRRLIVVSCGITKPSLRELVDDQLYYSLIWKKSHISSFFPPFAFMCKVFTQVIVSGNSIRLEMMGGFCLSWNRSDKYLVQLLFVIKAPSQNAYPWDKMLSYRLNQQGCSC